MEYLFTCMFLLNMYKFICFYSENEKILSKCMPRITDITEVGGSKTESTHDSNQTEIAPIIFTLYMKLFYNFHMIGYKPRRENCFF